MKLKSVKINYILSLIRILSSTVIGIFTMPYINKTLGADSLGKVEYVNSIISYFLLVSALGFPVYGIRQIAKTRDDKVELTKNVVEILVLLLITTLSSYFVLYVLLSFTDFFLDYESLVIIFSSSILLTNIGVEWFYQGIEDQFYITMRFLIIRIVTVILLFLLIKSNEDYLYYAGIVVLNLCGSNILNLIRLKKYIKIDKSILKNLNLKRHVKPALTIFIATISVSLYQIIDIIMLGYLEGDKYVGYYSVANKIIKYVVLFIVTIGAVLLPRLSNFWINDKEKYYDYLAKSFELILIISAPFIPFFVIFSSKIIYFMAGSEFQDSVMTMQILSPICLLVGFAYYFGYLILYPQGKEKYYTISVAISAIISVCLNLVLIEIYKHNGAAFAQVFAELVGVGLIIFFVNRYTSFPKLFSKNLLKIIIAILIVSLLSIIVFCYYSNFLSSFTTFILFSFGYFISYLIVLRLLKESNIMKYILFIMFFLRLK